MSRTRPRRVVAAFACVLALAFVAIGMTTGCSSPNATPAKAPVLQLWGDLKPVVSVKELMRDFIDPASDYVFDAIGTVITKDGEVQTLPKTDADWEKIRAGGVMLAEGVYLLKIPRPFAPPGDENNSSGPDPEELSPAQIKAKLEKDPVLWNAKIEALRNVGLQVLEIVKTRDANQLWDASDNLDNACESCHVAFWYPGEGALLKKLDRRLEERFGVHADRTGRSSGANPK